MSKIRFTAVQNASQHRPMEPIAHQDRSQLFANHVFDKNAMRLPYKRGVSASLFGH